MGLLHSKASKTNVKDDKQSSQFDTYDLGNFSSILTGKFTNVLTRAKFKAISPSSRQNHDKHQYFSVALEIVTITPHLIESRLFQHLYDEWGHLILTSASYSAMAQPLDAYAEVNDAIIGCSKAIKDGTTLKKTMQQRRRRQATKNVDDTSTSEDDNQDKSNKFKFFQFKSSDGRRCDKNAMGESNQAPTKKSGAKKQKAKKEIKTKESETESEEGETNSRRPKSTRGSVRLASSQPSEAVVKRRPKRKRKVESTQTKFDQIIKCMNDVKVMAETVLKEATGKSTPKQNKRKTQPMNETASEEIRKTPKRKLRKTECAEPKTKTKTKPVFNRETQVNALSTNRIAHLCLNAENDVDKTESFLKNVLDKMRVAKTTASEVCTQKPITNVEMVLKGILDRRKGRPGRHQLTDTKPKTPVATTPVQTEPEPQKKPPEDPPMIKQELAVPEPVLNVTTTVVDLAPCPPPSASTTPGTSTTQVEPVQEPELTTATFQPSFEANLEIAMENLKISITEVLKRTIEPIEVDPKVTIENLGQLLETTVKTTTTTVSETKNTEKTTVVNDMSTPAAEEADAKSDLPSVKSSQISLKAHTNSSLSIQTSTAITCSYKSGETNKACMKYTKTAEQALAVLNDEVSSALRDSFCSIDAICMSFRRTMDEIDQTDKQYETLRAQKNARYALSSPMLAEKNDQAAPTIKDSLLHALSLGLVQTQSENQLRLAVLDDKDTEAKRPKTPILPKIVPIIDTPDQPCTALKQQKKDVFNIPLQNGDSPAPETNKPGPTPSTPLSKFCMKKFQVKELAPEVKQRLREIAARLGLDTLPRSRARSNLHTRLIQEFMAADSLVEFQRQMAPINEERAVKEANDIKEAPQVEQPAKQVKTTKHLKARKSKKQLVQIMAEELYVPDRKINKIAETNLNTTSHHKPPLKLKPKTCQFLYREKKKKDHLQLTAKQRTMDATSSNTIYLPTKKQTKSKEPLISDDTQQKYADSLWFSARRKKSKTSSNSPSVVKCVSTRATIADNNVQTTQTDSDAKQRAWTGMQAVNYKTGLDCFDILDEITLKDLKPLESEYPRKDHLDTEAKTTVRRSYLYNLVYGSMQHQFQELLSLEEPQLHCTSPNCEKCKKKTIEVEICPSEVSKKSERSHTPTNHQKRTSSHTSKRPISQGKKKSSDIIIPLADGGRKLHHGCTKIEGDTGKSKSKRNEKMRLVLSTSSMLSSVKSNSIRSRSSGTRSIRPRSSDKNKRPSTSTEGRTRPNTPDTKVSQPPDGKRSKLRKRKKSAEGVADKLRPYLFDPRIRYPTTITVMPLTVMTYENPNFIHNKHASKDQGGDFCSSVAKQDPKAIKQTAKQSKATAPPEKRLWNHKYIKTPSYNLMSYLEKQNIDGGPHQQRCHDDGILHIPNIAPSPRVYKRGDAQEAMKSTRSLSPPTNRYPKSSSKSTKSPRVNNQQRQTLSSRKAALEHNLQHVIEMIEGKIVDIISTPDKPHTDSFNSVEKEIVKILRTIKPDEAKPLEAIDEAERESKVEVEVDGKRKYNKKRPCTKASPRRKGDGTDPLKASGFLTSDASHTTMTQDTDYLSSNEERFELTALYAPKLSHSYHGNVVIRQTKKTPAVKARKESPNRNKQKNDASPTRDKETPEHDAATVEENTGQLRTTENDADHFEAAENEAEQLITAENVADQVSDGPPSLIPTNTDQQDQSNEQQPDLASSKEPNYNTQVALLTSTPARNDEEEPTTSDNPKQEVAKPSETPSDVFLTPFMQAIRQRRREEHDNTSSCNILEFLDTLASISDETTPPPSEIKTGYQVEKISYRFKAQMAHIFDQSQIFCPIKIYHNAVLTCSPARSELMTLLESAGNSLRLPKLKELSYINEKIPAINLKRFIALGDLALNRMETTCCRMDKVLPRLSMPLQDPLTTLCTSTAKLKEAQITAIRSCTLHGLGTKDHSTLLNSLYGFLFTAVFLGLSLNYTCQ